MISKGPLCMAYLTYMQEVSYYSNFIAEEIKSQRDLPLQMLCMGDLPMKDFLLILL